MATRKATSKKTPASSRQTGASKAASGSSAKGAKASSTKGERVKKAVQGKGKSSSPAKPSTKPSKSSPPSKSKAMSKASAPVTTSRKKAVAPLADPAPVQVPPRKMLHAVVRDRPVHPEPRERIIRIAAPAQNILDSAPHESIDPGMLGNDDVHDETDYAQWMQLVEQAEIAKRAREMSRPSVDPNFDGEHCVDCDIDIPLKRLEHGFDRCVDCKQAIENEQARQKRLAG